MINGVGVVLKKEWRQLMRDGRLVLCAVMLFGLAVAACTLSYLDYAAQMETVHRGNHEARAHWEEQDAKNPHSAAHYGVYVFKEVDAAGLFDPGVLPYAGTTVFIEAHHKNDAVAQFAGTRGSLARFGSLNPAFLLIQLVPLVLILMSFGGIAGERTSGSIKMVATTGISPRSWLLGKWLAAALPGLICVFGVIGLCVFLGDGSTDDVPLWAAKALGYVLYLGGIVNITLWVSAKAKNHGAALLILMGLWISGSLVLPRVAANVAESMFPTPLQQGFKDQINAQKKEGVNDHVERVKSETLAKHGVVEVKDLPINYSALRMQSNEEYTDRLTDQHYTQLYQAQRDQLNVYRAFSLVWPMIPARFMSMGLSRSDMAAHHHFNQETEAYRRTFVKILNDDMMLNSRTGDWDYRSPAQAWAEMPDFENKARPWRVVLGDNLLDLGILAAWFLLSGLLLLSAGKNVFRSAS